MSQSFTTLLYTQFSKKEYFHGIVYEGELGHNKRIPAAVENTVIVYSLKHFRPIGFVLIAFRTAFPPTV